MEKTVQIEQHEVRGDRITIFRAEDIYPDDSIRKGSYYVHLPGRNSEYDTFQIPYSKGAILDRFGVLVKI